MKYDSIISIRGRELSQHTPAYFIAELAANHDGSLERNKELIWLAKESGADAVKLQHFKASELVSDHGFKKIKTGPTHQSAWKKSTYETYEQYETSRLWTEELYKTAEKANIPLLSSAYDYEAVDHLTPYVEGYKIGSGDITWTEFIAHTAQKNKPVFLATGASDISDVKRAVETVLLHTGKIVLMQCNTNYTGKKENFRYINLNVLRSFKSMYPGMILGLSDHTPGHLTALGAIALGAKVIEKHFTDDPKREGPDHYFSMSPDAWKEMVGRSRELEMAMGDGIKRIEENERETIIVQRRCIRLKHDLPRGTKIKQNDLVFLRPAPPGSLEPFRAKEIIGKTLKTDKVAGDALSQEDIA